MCYSASGREFVVSLETKGHIVKAELMPVDRPYLYVKALSRQLSRTDASGIPVSVTMLFDTGAVHISLET